LHDHEPRRTADTVRLGIVFNDRKKGNGAMHTIVICDDNANSLEVLNLAIQREPQFEVVANAQDGRTAIAVIEQHRPDIIILDIVMPEYDGIYIATHVRQVMEGYVPIIYVLSGLGTDQVARTLNGLGIDFFSVKPVSMSVIIQNLNMLAEWQGFRVFLPDPADPGDIKQEALENKIRNILLRLGIIPYRVSSKCLKEALVMYACHSEAIPNLSKDLYPQIADKYGLSVSAVERNIRHAVLLARKNQTDMYDEIFSYPANGNITTGEFLAATSDYISRTTKKVSFTR